MASDDVEIVSVKVGTIKATAILGLFFFFFFLKQSNLDIAFDTLVVTI